MMRARKCQELLPEAKVYKDKFKGIVKDKRYIMYYKECIRKGTPIPNGPVPDGVKPGPDKPKPDPPKKPTQKSWWQRAWDWTKDKAKKAKDWVVDKFTDKKKPGGNGKKDPPRPDGKGPKDKPTIKKPDNKPPGKGGVTRATNLMRARKC